MPGTTMRCSPPHRGRMQQQTTIWPCSRKSSVAGVCGAARHAPASAAREDQAQRSQGDWACPPRSGRRRSRARPADGTTRWHPPNRLTGQHPRPICGAGRSAPTAAVPSSTRADATHCTHSSPPAPDPHNDVRGSSLLVLLRLIGICLRICIHILGSHPNPGNKKQCDEWH
jgi:hypothetical protein